MPWKPCIECGTPTPDPRCPKHRLPPTNTRAETNRRAEVVGTWLRTYGPVCPGWRRPLHTVTASNLTADHIIPIAEGGLNGPLRVLCRACNSARGDGYNNPGPPPI